MIRRRIVLIYWVVAITMFIPSVAFAYIDPATTTYIIQIATALVITLGVSLSIFFYKFRMIYENLKVYASRVKIKLLSLNKNKSKSDIDANYNEEKECAKSEKVLKYAIPVKETYPNVVPKPEVVAEISGNSKVAKPGKIAWLTSDNRTYKKRLLITMLVFGAISFTFIIFGILDLVSSNWDSLPFYYKDILNMILLLGVTCIIIPALIVALFKGRLFDFIVCIAMCVLIGGYLQGNFLNIDIGALTGDAVNWEHYTGEAVKNSIIWLVIVIVIIAIMIFASKYWNGVCIFIPALLIVVQLVALMTVLPTTGPGSKAVTKGPVEILSEEGLSEVGSKNNIIYIVLDRLDETFVEGVIAERPDFFEPLDGFTRFTNNITKFGNTFPSVTEALTGEIYLGQTTKDEYFYDAYNKGTFLPDITSEDYKMNLFMEMGYTFSDVSQIRDYASNVREVEFNLNSKLTLRLLVKLSAYRYAPHVLKSRFWISLPEFNDTVYPLEGSVQTWKPNDALMYQRIIEDKLFIGDSENMFMYIHMHGPHEPLYLNEYIEQVPAEETSVIQQTIGSFNVVYEYLDQIKQLGLYENSTIIITGDHGYVEWWEKSVVTGLFVKPAGSAGTPLKSSQAPVSTGNLRATAIRAAEGTLSDASKTSAFSEKYGPTYFEVPEDSDVIRLNYWVGIDPETNKPYTEVINVIGDAHKEANWHPVERIPMKHLYVFNANLDKVTEYH